VAKLSYYVEIHNDYLGKYKRVTGRSPQEVQHKATEQLLSPDVAVMHAVGGTVMRGKSEPTPERDSIQTLVAVRQDGEWRLAAFQNTRLHPINTSSGPFLVWTLSDLLWKVYRLITRRIRRRRQSG